MTAGAAKCPVGWFGALLTFGQVPPPAAQLTLVSGVAPAPAPRGKETRLNTVVSAQPTQLELGRLYSCQGKSENRNETKCQSERGGAILI